MKQGLECGVLNTLPRSKVPAKHIVLGCVSPVEQHRDGGRLFAGGCSSSWLIYKAYVGGEWFLFLERGRVCNICFIYT